jgi:hypothetical protein
VRAVALVVVVAVTAAGCGPSDVCRRYVQCQGEVDASVDTTPYDDGGSCWLTLQTANACSEQCREALDALADVPGAPAVCAGG